MHVLFYIELNVVANNLEQEPAAGREDEGPEKSIVVDPQAIKFTGDMKQDNKRKRKNRNVDHGDVSTKKDERDNTICNAKKW